MGQERRKPRWKPTAGTRAVSLLTNFKKQPNKQPTNKQTKKQEKSPTLPKTQLKKHNFP